MLPCYQLKCQVPASQGIAYAVHIGPKPVIMLQFVPWVITGSETLTTKRASQAVMYSLPGLSMEMAVLLLLLPILLLALPKHRRIWTHFLSKDGAWVVIWTVHVLLSIYFRMCLYCAFL